jgi:hypothetical protein
MRLAELVETLLNALPDSDHPEDETWNWAWDQLSDDAQEAVKKARMAASSVLRRKRGA